MKTTATTSDERSELAIKFHMRVYNDEQLLRSLNRLWVEFGSELHKVMAGRHTFGRWMDGVSETIARVCDERHSDDTPF